MICNYLFSKTYSLRFYRKDHVQQEIEPCTHLYPEGSDPIRIMDDIIIWPTEDFRLLQVDKQCKIDALTSKR